MLQARRAFSCPHSESTQAHDVTPMAMPEDVIERLAARVVAKLLDGDIFASEAASRLVGAGRFDENEEAMRHVEENLFPEIQERMAALQEDIAARTQQLNKLKRVLSEHRERLTGAGVHVHFQGASGAGSVARLSEPMTTLLGTEGDTPDSMKERDASKKSGKKRRALDEPVTRVDLETPPAALTTGNEATITETGTAGTGSEARIVQTAQTQGEAKDVEDMSAGAPEGLVLEW